ncbi:MAG: GIDE domain-containing protein [Gallionella sp.]|nr:GIDE domain-containing protein [Gallionella sp.]MDD4958207.1 GIDE domain-containing protein [Gallionella sp.]
MLERLRKIQLATSGVQLLLLLAAVLVGSRVGWMVCLSIMSLISVFAWQSALSKYRAIQNTPTSKVASAAQGYVELMGRGYPFAVDAPVLGRLSKLPCLWYRYRIEQKNHKNEWHTTESGESDEIFVLRDDTGDCVIDPDYAEIITNYHQQWIEGARRYTEWLLLKEDPLYVLGELRTQGGGSLTFDLRAEHNALLAEWKQNMPDLLARFDLNADGQLGEEEWMLARRAAKREVSKKVSGAQSQADIHVIRQPADGKLFVISNLTPEKLSRRYLYWVWGNLLIFLSGLAGIGWVMQMSRF